MLGLLRKYQKIFLFIITVSVIISFAFFGTYSALTNQPKVRNPVVSQKMDGSNLTERELFQFSQFIAHDQNAAGSRHALSNFFNDSVIIRDFLQTGLAEKLFKDRYDLLKDDFEIRFDKIKRFKPFEHFQAPYISAKEIWSRYAPDLLESLEKLQAKETFDLEAFQLLSKLYIEQTKFTPFGLRRILMYQQEHYPNLTKDPRLYETDCTLFNFHSAFDWFSKKFVDLMSQFIIQTAALSRNEGMEISDAEAMVELTSLLKERTKHFKDMSFEEIYQKLLDALYMKEKELLSVYKDIALSRRYFQSKVGAIFLEPELFEDFDQYASYFADLKAYSLPEILDVKSSEEISQIEAYLTGLFKGDTKSLQLERLSAPQQDPELVHQKIEIAYAKLSSKEIEAKIPVKEMWNWQLEKKNYEKLKNQFSLTNVASREARYQALENLTKEKRLLIDQYSRKEMTKDSQALALAELDKKRLSSHQISLSKSNHLYGLDVDSKQLIDLLKSAPLSDQKDLNENDKLLQNRLLSFQDAKGNYYRIKVQKRSHFKPLTFQEARRLNVFEKMKKDKRSFKEGSAPYFLPYFKRAYADVVSTQDDSFFVKDKNDPLFDQFNLEMVENTLSRTAQTLDLFALDKGEFSAIQQDKVFYQVKDKMVKDSGSHAMAKKLIEDEARDTLYEEVLNKIQDHLTIPNHA